MTDVLGYPRFAAQGGDWGAFVSSVLGWRHPEKLIGIHLNLLAVSRDPKRCPKIPRIKKRLRTWRSSRIG